jgi:hypothetical protein
MLIFRALLAGIAVDAILIACGVAAYPASIIGQPRGMEFQLMLFMVAALLALYGVLANRARRATFDAAFQKRALAFGIAIGCAWSTAVLADNLLDLKTHAVGLGVISMVLVLSISAGAMGARTNGRLREGAELGLYSGMIGAVLMFAVALLMTLLAMRTLSQKADNLREFSGSGAPDIAAYVFKNITAVGTSHLVIGIALGFALGFLGGVPARRAIKAYK